MSMQPSACAGSSNSCASCRHQQEVPEKGRGSDRHRKVLLLWTEHLPPLLLHTALLGFGSFS